MRLIHAEWKARGLVAVAVTGLLALALAHPGAVAAQEQSTMALPATVSVSGHGEVKLPPDTASLTVGVDVTRPSLMEAQAEATSQATAIIEAAKATGIADEDIQTVNFSVWVMRNYDDSGNQAGIQGYQVSNQVSLTIRDIDAISELLEAVVAAGANNIYGITFFIDDTTEAAKEARKLAMADARDKAAQLAEAEGLSLGRVLAISEGVATPMPFLYGGMEARASGQGAGGAPIEIGSSQVTVDVQVTYALVEP